jgi:hypothetical protein
MKNLKYEIQITKHDDANNFYVVSYFGRKLFTTTSWIYLIEILHDHISKEEGKEEKISVKEDILDLMGNL